MSRLLVVTFLAVWCGACQLVRDRVGPGRASPGATADAGPVRVYFTTPGRPTDEPGNPADVLAGLIDEAQSTLDVAAFELDNVVIVDALVRATKRGVRVRLVTETDYRHESGPTELERHGVTVVDDRRSGSLMHNKFVVFDGRAVWTGSMNFTENCAYKNNNHGVYVADEHLAASYATKFAWMYERKKFGGAPDTSATIPYPKVELTDGTPVEVYFSTHDRPARHVLRRLETAKRSIHFLAFSFTDDAIGSEMLTAAKDGLDVSGVFEKSQSTNSHSEYARLKAAGLPVFLDGNPRNMHHKVIVIDGSTVLCGSFNFSKSADESNDENLLVIRNPAVAEAFEAEFRRVRATAAEAAGR